jgi:hypothetical protein
MLSFWFGRLRKRATSGAGIELFWHRTNHCISDDSFFCVNCDTEYVSN